jgi:shikimate kinase
MRLSELLEEPEMKNIVIITGFMGTGKTTIGKKVAESLSWQFFDMDSIIEEQEKMTVPHIFGKNGEEYFRNRESEVLSNLCQASHAVIATGGGTLLAESNRELALKNGIVFCLTASIDTLHQRLENSNHRPLLQENDLKDRILELWQARETIYQSLPNQIDTSSLSPDQVARKILQEFQQISNENQS